MPEKQKSPDCGCLCIRMAECASTASEIRLPLHTNTCPCVAHFLSEKRKVWGQASFAALESCCVHKYGFAKVSGVSNLEYLGHE